jgi:hypothetical protein
VIEGSELVFPNNVVAFLIDQFSTIDPDITVLPRRLRPNDPAQSISVVAINWVPDEYEIGNPGPVVNTYRYGIQALIKDMDEERGLSKHSVLSMIIRTMLYRNPSVRVGLAALSVTMDGSTERYQRSGVRTQGFMSNDIQGSFLYLSTLEFWLETETI